MRQRNAHRTVPYKKTMSARQKRERPATTDEPSAKRSRSLVSMLALKMAIQYIPGPTVRQIVDVPNGPSTYEAWALLEDGQPATLTNKTMVRAVQSAPSSTIRALAQPPYIMDCASNEYPVHRSLLIVAIQARRLDALETLLELGASWEPALAQAAPYPEFVAELLKRRVFPAAAVRDALDKATQFGAHESVQLLIEYCANAKITWLLDVPLLNSVAGGSQEGCIALLRAYQAQPACEPICPSNVTIAVTAKMFQLAIELSREGVDVNARNVYGDTILTELCMLGNCALLTFVLKRLGPDVNRPNIHGETPLHCACRVNAVACVKALLNAGADGRITNHKNQTPLIMARQFRRQKCAKLLEDHEKEKETEV